LLTLDGGGLEKAAKVLGRAPQLALVRLRDSLALIEEVPAVQRRWDCSEKKQPEDGSDVAAHGVFRHTTQGRIANNATQ
jgi:hypothetical protein